MSATFRAMSEQGLCDMGYGMVHKVRILMLQYIGELYGNGTEWADRYKADLFAHDDEDISELFRQLISIWTNTTDETKSRRLWAVIDFCDHSDCDGRFYECKDIVEVLGLTICMVDNIPENVKDKMVQLQELFAKAGDDGFVEIT